MTSDSNESDGQFLSKCVLNEMFSLSCFHRRLITDSKVKLKYQHLITNSFVEVSSGLKLYANKTVVLRLIILLHLGECVWLQKSERG